LFPGFPTDCSSRSFFTSWRSLVITTNRGLWVLAGTKVWPETVFEQNLTKFFWYRKEVLFRLNSLPGSCYFIWVSLNFQFGSRSFPVFAMGF
jgi:hypothetical protein